MFASAYSESNRNSGLMRGHEFSHDKDD